MEFESPSIWAHGKAPSLDNLLQQLVALPFKVPFNACTVAWSWACELMHSHEVGGSHDRDRNRWR